MEDACAADGLGFPGDLTRKQDVPAGIRTRVGSSGGSQDIHYPTETTTMPLSPTVKGQLRSCREKDIFHYNNAT